MKTCLALSCVLACACETVRIYYENPEGEKIDADVRGVTPDLAPMMTAPDAGHPDPSPLSLAAPSLCLVNRVGSQSDVRIFDRTMGGDLTPTAIFSPAAIGLNNPSGIAFDATRKLLLVGDAKQDKVVLLDVQGTMKGWFGAHGSLDSVALLALDGSHQELFVLGLSGGAPKIDVYAWPATMASAPTRSVSVMKPAWQTNFLSMTLLQGHDELVLADSAKLSVISRTATGAATELRTIRNPQPPNLLSLWALDYDPGRDQIIGGGPGPGPNCTAEDPCGGSWARGVVALARTAGIPPHYDWIFDWKLTTTALAFEATSDVVYFGACTDQSCTRSEIVALSRGGGATPQRTIVGVSTGLGTMTSMVLCQ